MIHGEAKIPTVGALPLDSRFDVCPCRRFPNVKVSPDALRVIVSRVVAATSGRELFTISPVESHC